MIYTNNENKLNEANFYIITVPTPINNDKTPNLTPVIKASETVSKFLSKGDIVVYESTVYPGVTEEICVPILESVSRLQINKDFFVGYSPERINPGDKEHTVTKIKKWSQDLQLKHFLRYLRYILQLLQQEFMRPKVSKWLRQQK